MTAPRPSKADFWDEVWGAGETAQEPCTHPLRGYLERFVREHGLEEARTLEVGCGAGGLQGLSSRYVGTDISAECAKYLRAPATFICCPATALPFPDDSFDFVFSIYVLEHVADVAAAVAEIRRVTRPDGLILLKPAWFCRPWNGREWHHKRREECSRAERLLKAAAWLRNLVLFRAAHLMQWRLRGLASGDRLRYRKIVANYDMPHVIDADAEVWLDPLDVIRWFGRQGDLCLSHPSFLPRWVRTSDPVIFKVQKHRVGGNSG